MRKILATLFAAALAIGIPATAASAEETASTCSYECTWQGETGWAYGSDFAGANWAMFYTLQAKPSEKPYESTPIYAGQHYLVGHAYFGPSSIPGMITIYVVLDGPNGDGAYIVGGESVKVGHWTKDPSGITNPPPGKLKYKGTAIGNRYAEVTVRYVDGKTNYYAIHLDMLILSPSS
ncbi:hypothetical protein [Demequina rhizosphaerae]|uniref:hypothetical protein n=1 Tax=Demequina rhizosphaerae TaxID=1638985 RepID=UPI0007852B64|nr:hypothetical protein [Demequina rhizosphaerae]